MNDLHQPPLDYSMRLGHTPIAIVRVLIKAKKEGMSDLNGPSSTGQKTHTHTGKHALLPLLPRLPISTIE